MEELEKTKKAALRLLAFRPRSESELRARLARRKLPGPSIDHVIVGLRKQGMLDDERFAKLYALSRIQSGSFGKGRVRRELTQRGLPGALVEKTMALIVDIDELSLARELARTRLALMKGLSSDMKKRRLHGLLLRRGFSAGTVYKVLGELVGPVEEE